MKKFVTDDISYYEDFKSDMHFFWKEYIKTNNHINSKILETSYLYRYVDLQDDEHYRICILLPLIKVEIENNILSKELLEELEIYYEDFNNGVLDDELYEHEYEAIKEDLYWCYNNM